MHDSGTDLHDIWRTARKLLDERVTGPAQRAWLDRTHPIGLDDTTLVLAAPDTFAREQLDGRYGPQLREAISAAAGRALGVVVTVQAGSGPVVDVDDEHVWIAQEHADPGSDEHEPPAPAHTAPVASTNGVRPAQLGPESFPTEVGELATALNPSHTFDRFVIGANNRFAHAAAFAVAEAPAKAFNPLFIYGGAGLGKTHLIQAVAHYSARLFPHINGRYVTSEQFTNEFIDAISNKRSVPFQRRYRDVDLLLIDDVQFLARKPQTQEEFFHTFNVLHNAGKQIVITSDRPPKQIGHLEERLRTRFEQGLICDVQPPELETRLAILRRKSAHEGYQVPDEVLELIADRISSNIRELEGALIRVTAFASIHGVDVTPKLASIVLQDLYPDGGSAEVNVSLIMSETASYFGFTVDDLVGPRRTRPLANARQIAMYLTRELTDLSLPKIGQAFGDRDHSTVQHANKKIGELIGTRADLLAQIQELTSRIKVATRR